MLAAVACCALIACSQTTERAAPREHRSVPSQPPQPVRSHSGAALDADFPDPTVIRAPDGAYYGYATQVVGSSATVNVQVARSEDLRAWTHVGDALPDKPSWAKTTQSFWAPHVIERDGTFYLYYSAVPDDGGQDETCLAVATSRSPEGPFQDAGQPLLCGYEIDPMIFRDPRSGKWYVYWGSAGDIAVQTLADDLLHLAGETPRTLLLGWSSPKRRPYERGIEGPFVTHRNGWYYLFYSGDRCCEFPPHYAVLVARSRRADGGFRRFGSVEGRDSSVILSNWGRWTGPGHCSVVRDERGREWIVYHAIDRRRPFLPTGDVRRVMLIDRLDYREGWPVVRRRAGIRARGLR
jgi:arabinan endo-1,5-alpha-L-arabinosidase